MDRSLSLYEDALGVAHSVSNQEVHRKLKGNLGVVLMERGDLEDDVLPRIKL